MIFRKSFPFSISLVTIDILLELHSFQGVVEDDTIYHILSQNDSVKGTTPYFLDQGQNVRNVEKA